MTWSELYRNALELLIYLFSFPWPSQYGVTTRDVIDMVQIDITITLLKQYNLLSLVNTHINVSKYQKHENGHLE